MPEIGAALREARMRQRIDISEIEAQTKIRAKYLRALENEEWDLLPGSTFVKSFLRTYAEALGLDARLLLEEYKLRHERLSEADLMPIAPPGGRRDKPRRGPSPGVGRDIGVALLVVALVGLLIVLGNNSDDEGGRDQVSATTTTTRTSPPARTTPEQERKRPEKPAVSKFARLEILPTADVWICLEAAGNRRLIGGEVVDETTELPRFRSSRFRMTFGNGELRMRINGKTLDVPEVQNAVGYEIDRSGKRTTLAEADRPTCS
ncbi:MAG: helix-turn-helix domain-containing protein [Solirubrobacteraceae bacterium]